MLAKIMPGRNARFAGKEPLGQQTLKAVRWGKRPFVTDSIIYMSVTWTFVSQRGLPSTVLRPQTRIARRKAPKIIGGRKAGKCIPGRKAG